MAYQAILRVYKGFSGGGWPRAWRGVRVADMGGRTTPLRSPYKPGQVPHSAHTRLKSQQAAFPLGEEVRISRLGLKPACFALPLRQSASLTACGGVYVNGQRPITANGDYRLQYSHWTLTHQPFSDLDYRRLQVEHPHLVLDTYALHVRPPQQVGVRSQGSIGRAPLYPVGVRGARYHGQGSWAGECGSPGSLGKGELGSWSERAHNPIAQETAISIQCRAASQ